ncbi:MAG TPA: hypothetical protein VG294_12115 [Solirubrobacteraceae bacterium]|jgi:hypothetical protein|nr:hypothetical protein [Solirubrobacteraceae bacterium]
MRRVRIAAAGFVLAAGFCLVLIDTVDAPELYAGAVVALLAAAVFGVSREQGLAEAEIALDGWRALGGCYCAYRRRSPRSEPSRRRALAEALGSLTPNTIVIGIDTERGLLLVHQLRRQGRPEELDVMRPAPPRSASTRRAASATTRPGRWSSCPLCCSWAPQRPG